MKKSWGESFLKSGLPLEHVVAVKLREDGWTVAAHFEYERAGSDTAAVFEIDLTATTAVTRGGTDLHLLIECKYHETSRFWMFHPHETPRLTADNVFLNPAPFQTLRSPNTSTVMSLAPQAYWGVVVSEDAQKQDNAIYTALQQLAYAFLPYVTSHVIADREGASASGLLASCVVPVIVTNARIFRLRPDVHDLNVIREAAGPTDVADELQWMWCFNEPTDTFIRYNRSLLESFYKDNSSPAVRLDEHMRTFQFRPVWFAVVHVGALSVFTAAIRDAFLQMPILDGIVTAG